MSARTSIFIPAIFILILASCNYEVKQNQKAYFAEGERLAKTLCISCHTEVPPALLTKKLWMFKVLPQMGPRLGMFKYKEMYYQSINPILVPKSSALTQAQWENIVDYFYIASPDSLPEQEFKKAPNKECMAFKAVPFSRDIDVSAIITAIEADEPNRSVYAADAVSRSLLKLDYTGKIKDKISLESPATALHISNDHIDVALAGILHPNNEDLGKIVQYQNNNLISTQKPIALLDHLYRPVYSLEIDLNYDGYEDILTCEYGNDIGKLCIYYQDGQGRYSPYLIEETPGAIVARTHDFDKDGFLDLTVLFAQGDERIVIYFNDGKGNFKKKSKVVLRFPSVYGSMYFDLFDFNHDGDLDIIYVNGDNFDYSQILKPYHGIRIYQNDRKNNFSEKYFFPVYGAGRVALEDFDLDGDTDLVVVSNFADMERNPERGIIYLQNEHLYEYIPYSIPEAAQNQWNTMKVIDIDGDGDKDILVGAMNLSKVTDLTVSDSTHDIGSQKTALLLLKNQARH